MGEKLTLCFEVEMSAEWLCDKETLDKEYSGSWESYIKELYREEGVFWDEELKLVSVKVTS